MLTFKIILIISKCTMKGIVILRLRSRFATCSISDTYELKFKTRLDLQSYAFFGIRQTANLTSL